jgi:hypothetical protein
MSGDQCTAPGVVSLSTLSLAERRDLLDTQGKCPLARNTDRNLRHHHFNKAFYNLAHCSMDNRLRSQRAFVLSVKLVTCAGRDKDDSEIKSGVVHKFPGICLITEENLITVQQRSSFKDCETNHRLKRVPVRSNEAGRIALLIIGKEGKG